MPKPGFFTSTKVPSGWGLPYKRRISCVECQSPRQLKTKCMGGYLCLTLCNIYISQAKSQQLHKSERWPGSSQSSSCATFRFLVHAAISLPLVSQKTLTIYTMSRYVVCSFEELSTSRFSFLSKHVLFFICFLVFSYVSTHLFQVAALASGLRVR